MTEIDMTALGKPDCCRHCGGQLNDKQWVHTECLKTRHGGELPEGHQELIDAFELDPEKSI